MVFVLTAFVIMGGFLATRCKMSNIVAMLLVATAVTLGNSAYAQLAKGPLGAAQIRQSMFGFAMTGEYSNGKSWAERFNRDGSTSYVEDGIAIPGKMTLKSNLLCFDYGETSGFAGGCFEVWKRSANCFDFYSENVDGGTIASLDEKRFGQGWTARAWYTDQPSTCVSDQIS